MQKPIIRISNFCACIHSDVLLCLVDFPLFLSSITFTFFFQLLFSWVIFRFWKKFGSSRSEPGNDLRKVFMGALELEVSEFKRIILLVQITWRINELKSLSFWSNVNWASTWIYILSHYCARYSLSMCGNCDK